MSNFMLGSRSVRSLVGVHPDLLKIVRRALEISSIDFSVIEGVRSPERQQRLYRSGATKTLHSRHLTGHAVDIVPWVMPHGIDWNNIMQFRQVGHAMKTAAAELGIRMEWGAKKTHGGDWNSFNDMPHYQLSRRDHP